MIWERLEGSYNMIAGLGTNYALLFEVTVRVLRWPIIKRQAARNHTLTRSSMALAMDVTAASTYSD
jgi:hypothetical protein